MYDELVKKIRHCATDPMHCLSCGEDKDGLCFKRLMTQAADAIESLAERIEGTRWISVEDDLPKDTKPVLAYYGFPGSEEIGLYYQGVLSYYPTDDRPHWQHESSGVTVLYWKPLTMPQKEE